MLRCFGVGIICPVSKLAQSSSCFQLYHPEICSSAWFLESARHIAPCYSSALQWAKPFLPMWWTDSNSLNLYLFLLTLWIRVCMAIDQLSGFMWTYSLFNHLILTALSQTCSHCFIFFLGSMSVVLFITVCCPIASLLSLNSNWMWIFDGWLTWKIIIEIHADSSTHACTMVWHSVTCDIFLFWLLWTRDVNHTLFIHVLCLQKYWTLQTRLACHTWPISGAAWHRRLSMYIKHMNLQFPPPLPVELLCHVPYP